MVSQLVSRFGNATADFLRREVVGTETDTHGDEYEVTEWVLGDENVTVRYEERGSHRADDVFDVDKSGYDEQPIARLFAPGHIGDTFTDGDRARVHYRGTTREFRMASLDHKTFDAVGDGYIAADLLNFGDETTATGGA